MLTAIIEAAESRAVFHAFKGSLERDAELCKDKMVGFQGGNVRCDVHWHRDSRFWSHLRERTPSGERAHCEHDKFWCAFRIEEPWSRGGLSITVEINAPHHGRNWRVAGAFARSQDGAVWIAHSGRVNVGRKGFSKADFLEFLPTGNAAFQTETVG